MAILLFSACDNNNGNQDPCSVDFDQSAMYTNLADNVIIPSYLGMRTSLVDLKLHANAFLVEPTEIHLENFQAAYIASHREFQKIAPFNFGPAGEVFLRSSVNNFPVNVDEIHENIAGGNYDFNLPDRYDKGFPAMDYLLFGIAETPAEIVDKYVFDPQATANKKYLEDVVNDIISRVEHTADGWLLDGYRESFINNTGTAAGTSLSLIINSFNEHYEIIKREKIGIPSGVLTLGFTNPTKTEAFYSGKSAALALEALNASKRLYLGESLNGSNGLGLDDYLAAAIDEQSLEDVDARIQTQFNVAIQSVEGITDPYSEFVDSNQAEAEAAYAEVSKQLINIKTDMPTIFCVAITYVDNPSDSD